MKLPGNGMSWKEFLRALGRAWNEDQIGSNAGALAFSGMLALFPFLLFLIALGSFVIRPEQVETIVSQLGKIAPPDVTRLVGAQIKHLAGGNIGLLTVGIIGAIWAASGGAVSATQALNVTYRVREGRPFWKTRGTAVLATVVVAILILIAALFILVAPAVAAMLPGPIGTLVLWLRWPISGLIMMFVWAVLYYLLPDVEQTFKFITPGSVAGVIIWLIASWGFAEYVTHFGKYNATYGALGGAVVLLLWMYIASLVFILGAVVNAIIEHESPEGKRAGAKRRSDVGQTQRSTESLPSTATRRPGEPTTVPQPVAVSAGPVSPYPVPARRAPPRGRLGVAGTFALALGVGAGIATALKRPARA